MSWLRASRAATRLIAAASALVVLVGPSATVQPVEAQGVGRATWTPTTSTTQARPSRFLVAGDAITYQTDAAWSRSEVDGLSRYVAIGLRYTHEVNDRSGRLNATGYWATNHPDPAYDRDDDDGDGRWEEAEITAGEQLPTVDQVYSSIIQFSRWHPKRQRGACGWAWDRRQGAVEVLSQLSRDLLGEWQAERYTLTYDQLAYPRVGMRPELPDDTVAARCRVRRPGPDQHGVVVTFAAPVPWATFLDLQTAGDGRWTAFEAVGRHAGDRLTWTCGGPVDERQALGPCRDMGVRPDGVSAALGFFDGAMVDRLRADAIVAEVDDAQDAVTGLLFEVGGFGIEAPDLGINDSYWERFLAD